MVRSLGLHRIEVRSYWGLVARVNLILLVHNLIRSRVLLKMARGSYEVAHEGMIGTRKRKDLSRARSALMRALKTGRRSPGSP